MRSLTLILPPLVAGLLVVLPSAGEAQTLRGDPFLCYQVVPELYRATTVGIHLVDPFRETVTDRAQLAKGGLCVPASAAGASITDASTYLEGYRVPSDASLELSNVGVDNLLGPQLIDIHKPYALLVPTALDPEATPPVPDPATHRLDAYTCYRATRTRGTPKHKVQVTLADVFTSPPKVFDVVKPVHLCVSASLNGERVRTGGDFFTCYKIKPARGQPKHVRQFNLHVNNMFHANTLSTKRERELCVPSVVDLPRLEDPMAVAPPIRPDVATDFADAAEVL